MTARSRKYIFFSLYTIAFLVLAGFAAFFYRERMFGEVGMDILCVINREHFCVLSGRYGMIFPQLIPVILVKMQLPLKAVLVSYSVSVVAFYFILMVVAHWRYNDQLTGLAFILMLTVNLKSTYFLWSMSEIQYGTGLLILIHTITRYGSRTTINVLLTGVLVFFAIYSHPLVVYLLFVLIVFHVCENGFRTIPKNLVVLMTWTAVFMVLKYILMPSQYDFVKLDSQFNQFTLASSFSRTHLLSFLQSDLLMVLLWMVVLIFYAWKRNYRKLALYVFSFAGLYMLLFAGAPASGSASYHVAYGPALTGLLLFPLIYDVLGSSKRIQFKWLVLLIILSSAVRGQYRIHSMAWLFKHEVRSLEEIIDYSHRRNIQRAILKNDNLCTNCLRPYYHQHSLLLSSLNGPEYTVELEMDEQILRDHYDDTLLMDLDLEVDSHLETYMTEVEKMLPSLQGPDSKYTISQYDLNPHYFGVSEDRHRVFASNKVNTFEQLDSSLVIEITEPDDIYLKAGLWHPISVSVSNLNSQYPVYAGADNNLLIEIHWSDPDIETTYAALYGDIYESYKTYIMLKMPFGQNVYPITALMTQHGRQVGNKDDIKVHIK